MAEKKQPAPLAVERAAVPDEERVNQAEAESAAQASNPERRLDEAEREGGVYVVRGRTVDANGEPV